MSSKLAFFQFCRASETTERDKISKNSGKFVGGRSMEQAGFGRINLKVDLQKKSKNAENAGL